jgi:phage terminase large subunit GpA-like protein
VYSYVQPDVAHGVFAIKGANIEGAPLLSKPTRNNSAKAILYMVGSSRGRSRSCAASRSVLEPGPRYIHLPADLDGEQVAQFTREKLVAARSKGGKRKRVWIQSGRNEMIDLYVYALAHRAAYPHYSPPDPAIARTSAD